LDGNWIQLAYQLADSAAGLSWSFGVTYLILVIMNKIPGLTLRADPHHEHTGLDLAELGEPCYGHHDEKGSGIDTHVEIGEANSGTQSVESLNVKA
jgi:Amt family ammonium transporter